MTSSILYLCVVQYCFFALLVLIKKRYIRLYLKILDLILVDVLACLDAFILFFFFQMNNLKII